jgi:hypothetical protein
MPKPLFTTVLAALLLLSTGCFFARKKPAPKENTAIAAEVEESFRRRWLDKRAAELVAQGTAAEAARTQADSEFRERYGFMRAGQKN